MKVKNKIEEKISNVLEERKNEIVKQTKINGEMEKAKPINNDIFYLEPSSQNFADLSDFDKNTVNYISLLENQWEEIPKKKSENQKALISLEIQNLIRQKLKAESILF